MCADADGAKIFPHALLCLQPDAPFRDLDRKFSGPARRGNILAAGDHGGLHAAGVGKQLLCRPQRQDPAGVHHGDGPAHVIGLGAVMRHHQHLAAEAGEQIAQLDLQRVAQMPVQRGKGLVKKKQLRIADQDARERHALLLPAGELMRPVLFQPPKLHQPDHIPCPALTLGAVFYAAKPAEDILLHRHIGEKRVVLKQVAHAPLLRGQVDLLLRIEQHPPVELDMTLVRLLDPGDAFERHAFAAARGAQQAGHAVRSREMHVETKRAQLLLDIDHKTHFATAFFCRLSSMFTASSTTVLIARLTSTQNSAPRSSFVRQS